MYTWPRTWIVARILLNCCSMEHLGKICCKLHFSHLQKVYTFTWMTLLIKLPSFILFIDLSKKCLQRVSNYNFFYFIKSQNLLFPPIPFTTHHHQFSANALNFLFFLTLIFICVTLVCACDYWWLNRRGWVLQNRKKRRKRWN